MARVTVEDCIKHIEDRFELLMLAAHRSRALLRSHVEPVVERGQDKSDVVALREIASGALDIEALRSDMLEHYRYTQSDTDEHDTVIESQPDSKTPSTQLNRDEKNQEIEQKKAVEDISAQEGS